MPPGPGSQIVVSSGLNGVERQAIADARFEEITKLRKDISSGRKKLSMNDATMWSVANRYAPERSCTGNSIGVTVVLFHAGGFHKEIWETTLRYLLSMPQGQANVDEIWSLDAANHGDSALINNKSLGETFEWSDHARDILNFLGNYLLIEPKTAYSNGTSNEYPTKILGSALNAVSRIVKCSESVIHLEDVHSALDGPSLFSSIIFVDPVIYPLCAAGGSKIRLAPIGALIRREQWQDRESARTGLLKSPFFQAWHPDALEDYVQYGTVEDEHGVKLKCSGYQEAVTFNEIGRLPCEVWEMLPMLDQRIPLKWIMDSTNGDVRSGGRESAQHVVWLRASNSTNIQIKGAGHMIPQEAPKELGS
ncbi:Alpha/beta hydrolase family [Rhizoctonia solani]|uniref:Alpha/beta hydrolase family n=1 Tax=Rhizoctonia solani TaxID=456999 RepID=A0A8H7ICS6_9AGAM|nr:Alpha/beta hydrolase family [Rhizoctonia solani]